jgi:hypothetical protein
VAAALIATNARIVRLVGVQRTQQLLRRMGGNRTAMLASVEITIDRVVETGAANDRNPGVAVVAVAIVIADAKRVHLQAACCRLHRRKKHRAPLRIHRSPLWWLYESNFPNRARHPARKKKVPDVSRRCQS